MEYPVDVSDNYSNANAWYIYIYIVYFPKLKELWQKSIPTLNFLFVVSIRCVFDRDCYKELSPCALGGIWFVYIHLQVPLFTVITAIESQDKVVIKYLLIYQVPGLKSVRRKSFMSIWGLCYCDIGNLSYLFVINMREVRWVCFKKLIGQK